MKHLSTYTSKKPVVKHYFVRGHRLLISILLSAGLTVGMMGNANADCKFFHPGHCIEDAGNAIVDTTTTIVNDVANTTTNAANDVANFSETAVTISVNTIEDGLNQAATAIEGVAISVYKKSAELMYQQMGTPMNNMANAWKNLIASEPAKYQRLVNAIQANDGPEIQAALEDVLVSLYTYAGFAAIVQDFKDKNAGSLLFIVSAGAGVGVTVEGDIGLAIDIDYLSHLANRVANGYTSSTFSGAIGSLFTAVGIQVGPAAGGGVDFIAGYHLANPDGVYGPGLDISLEIKAAAGGGIGFSYDLSQAPWEIVTGGIGVGAGVEVKLAIGPSYALVLGQLCSNGSLKEFANQCPTSSPVANTTLLQNYWKQNEYLNIESGNIASSPVTATIILDPLFNAHVWNVESVSGTHYVRLRSAYDSNKRLNVEFGSLQASTIWDGAHSAMWIKEAVSGIDNTFRLRNRWTGGYLNIESGSIAVDESWVGAWSSWWVFN